MSTAPLLELAAIGKSFSGVPVLHDIGFSIHAGGILGIVGENGSGKSTCMNVVAGVLSHDSGEMRLEGVPYTPRNPRDAEAAGIGFIQQELNIFPNLSVAENLFMGRSPRVHRMLPLISRKQRRLQAKRWLDMVGLKIDPDASAARLSAGERQLLEIARALSLDARLLIFDEPTTSLATREAERLFALIKRLRDDGMAIIFISHALGDVLALADKMVILRDGKVVLDRPRSGLAEEQLVFAMVGREIQALFPPRPAASPSSDAPLLRVDHISATNSVADISFSVTAGEVVGIAGLMGSGRTELARILFGLDRHHSGSLIMDGVTLPPGRIASRIAAGMALLTEDRRHEGLLAEASVADNIALASLTRFVQGGAIRQKKLVQACAALGERLRLKSGPIETTKIATLSGGNQQKALFARWMLTRPRLLILDEPTRGVDIGAKQDIYNFIGELAEAGAGIVIISSEIEEIMGLADRILVMHRGRISGEFPRNTFDRETLLGAAFGQRKVA